MEIHEVGKCVQIGEKLIPAVNIQIEGVPGYLTNKDGTRQWYGIYFEVMFEGGEYWVVERGFQNNIGVVQMDGVWVAEYDSKNPQKDAYDVVPSYGWYAPSWEAFLVGYEVKVLSKYPYTWRHLLDPSLAAVRRA